MSPKCPQLIDNSEVKYTMNHPEPGMSCKTCVFFSLPVPLEEGEKQPIKARIDLSDEELLDLRGALIHGGFCTRMLMGSPPAMLINVWSDHGCEYYEERPAWTLFRDDGAFDDDDPYQGPVTPTTY